MDDEDVTPPDALPGSVSPLETRLPDALEELIAQVVRIGLWLEEAEPAEWRLISRRLARLKKDVAALPETARKRASIGFAVRKRKR